MGLVLFAGGRELELERQRELLAAAAPRRREAGRRSLGRLRPRLGVASPARPARRRR